jgi:hypothetical protein
MLSELTHDQQTLVAAMSDLSEAGYHAGWIAGLEYDLWRLLLANGDHYGRHDVSAEELGRLRHLAEQCGGWIVFDDEKEETFVPLAEWQRMFVAHTARIAPPKK